MAYGQFVDYRALPQPDAFAFQRSEGPPLTLFGPAALDLKRRLDAYQATQPQPVAGPGTGEVNASEPEPMMCCAA